MAEMVQSSAQNQVVSTRVVMQHFNEAGLSLSYAQQKALEQQLQSTMAQVGGEETYNYMLGTMGFTPDLYSNMSYSSACYQALNDYYYGDNGVNKPTDEELIAQFEQTYPDAIAAEHILISLTDPETGETRTADEARALAQEVLDRLNAGENFEDVMNRALRAIRTAMYSPKARCSSRSMRRPRRWARTRSPVWSRPPQATISSSASRWTMRPSSIPTAKS